MLFENIATPRAGDRHPDKRRRLHEAVLALHEATMPRPVKGGFTIPGTVRGDGVPIDVLSANIYDNTWAIEKAKGGYLLFHVQSGAQAGAFKTAKDAQTALQAAYDIAPPSGWKFSGVKDAPQALLSKWHATISHLIQRSPSIGSVLRGAKRKSIEPDPKNRRAQTAGIKKDIPGWVKLAWKHIVKSAKERVKKEVQTAYSTNEPGTPRGHYRPMRVFPQRVEAVDTSTLWDFETKYTAHGISRNPPDYELIDLANWKPATKNATASIRAGIQGPERKYKFSITVRTAEWAVVQQEQFVKVTYKVVATLA